MNKLKKIEVFVQDNDNSKEDVVEELKNNYKNQNRVGKKVYGIYFEPEVREAIESVAKEIGPRMISKFVNDVMKKYLQENKYL
ncbi:hypothetical protein HPT25_23650 [Bacillus sp. BRMEA1]|uniref:hypothetical protein n=1 Tax=Neobacillus endophyticus TaxID=2738405 RepID=UPI0015665443|nr:hypothetical protein [Neobacillus endophyticus]NRD80321.1 hypothetical protein [Neobacillus endophyticus]